ncbi:MAG: LLM class flavin-dependent oxidoreductase [Mesorhizobium sp.]
MAIQLAIEEKPGTRISAIPVLEDVGISSLILGEEPELNQNMEVAARAVTNDSASTIYCAHWAGDSKPVVAANQLAFLDDRLFGRLGLRIAERSYPELGHEAAWRRVDEYLTLLKRLWSNSKPIDHEGEFYSIQRGFVENKGPQGALLPIRMSGLTGTAIQVCARHATTFDLAYASPTESGATIQKLREAASRFGRTRAINFAIRIPADEIEGKLDIEAALHHYADVGVSEFIFDTSTLSSFGKLLRNNRDEAPNRLVYARFGRSLRQAN